MISLSEMSNAQLADLIRLASTELHERLTAPKLKAAPEPERPVELAPTKTEEALIEACISRMRSERVVLADERKDFKRLHNQYQAWFRWKGYPSDVTGANAKSWLRVYGNKGSPEER